MKCRDGRNAEHMQNILSAISADLRLSESQIGKDPGRLDLCGQKVEEYDGHKQGVDSQQIKRGEEIGSI